jgi:hypothetical protein
MPTAEPIIHHARERPGVADQLESEASAEKKRAADGVSPFLNTRTEECLVEADPRIASSATSLGRAPKIAPKTITAPLMSSEIPAAWTSAV